MARGRNQYYRNKFIIGVYSPIEDGETLLALCDNVYEFSEFLKVNKTDAAMILYKSFTHKISFIRLFGKCCTIEFIKADDIL